MSKLLNVSAREVIRGAEKLGFALWPSTGCSLAFVLVAGHTQFVVGRLLSQPESRRMDR